MFSEVSSKYLSEHSESLSSRTRVKASEWHRQLGKMVSKLDSKIMGKIKTAQTSSEPRIKLQTKSRVFIQEDSILLHSLIN